MPFAASVFEGTAPLLAALAALAAFHWRDHVRSAEYAEVTELAHNIDTTRNARQVVCDEARVLTGADAVQLQEADDGGTLRSVATSGEAPLLACDGQHAAPVLAGISASIAAEPVREGRHALGRLLFVWRDDSRRGANKDRRLAALFAEHAATILARADHEERLGRLAYFDGLTGLPNRRALDDQIARELARAEREGTPLSIAILDLDRFKAYNDTNGHPAGDRLLKRVAAGVAGTLRASDFCARYGGEEFAVLMPACGAVNAAETIERMRAAMPDEQTFSAGVASWDGLETVDALLVRADSALYAAKEGGRARTVLA